MPVPQTGHSEGMWQPPGLHPGDAVEGATAGECHHDQVWYQLANQRAVACLDGGEKLKTRDRSCHDRARRLYSPGRIHASRRDRQAERQVREACTRVILQGPPPAIQLKLCTIDDWSVHFARTRCSSDLQQDRFWYARSTPVQSLPSRVATVL